MGGFILKVTKSYQYQSRPYGAILPAVKTASNPALNCRVRIFADIIAEYPILFDPVLGYYIDLPDGLSIDFIEIDGIRYSASSSPFPNGQQFWQGGYQLPPTAQEKICIDLV